LVKLTYLADADLDGDVDLDDVGRWAPNYTGAGGSTAKTWTQFDTDYDGDVDLDDVGKWAPNYTGAGGGGFQLAPLPGGVSAVPEPASLGLLMVGGAVMLRRRRK
jgi:hypothetical protein